MKWYVLGQVVLVAQDAIDTATETARPFFVLGGGVAVGLAVWKALRALQNDVVNQQSTMIAQLQEDSAKQREELIAARVHAAKCEEQYDRLRMESNEYRSQTSKQLAESEIKIAALTMKNEKRLDL